MVKASAFLLVLLATSASGQLFTSSASSNSAIDKKSSGDKKKNLFTKRHQQVNAPQKGNPLLDQFLSKVQEVKNTPTPTTLLSTLIGLITLLLSIVTRKKYNKSNSNTQLLTEEQPTLGGQDTDSDSEESGSDSNDEGSDSIDTTPGESYDDFLEFLATPSQRRLVVDN